MSLVTGTGEDVINRRLEVQLDGSSFADDFVSTELLQRCRDWIVAKDCENVGLQFPDALLSKSAIFYCALKQLLPENVALYVLADSSFAPCCSDVLTAEHTSCDSLIHFGHACLTQLEHEASVNLLNVFIPPTIDLTDLLKHLKQLDSGQQSDEVLLLYDVVFSDRLEQIAQELSTVFGERLVVSKTGREKVHQSDGESLEDYKPLKYGRLVPRGSKLEADRFDVLYIANSRSKAKLLFQLAFWKQASRFLIYESDTKKLTVNVRASSKTAESATSTSIMSKYDEMMAFLKRRFVVVQRLREARTIGLLVGSLHLANGTELLDVLRILVRRSGRRAYTFAVGRLNMPKLANYLEVDAFCLVSCQESSLFDDAFFVREFHAPLCTPFELTVALKAPSVESIASLLFDDQASQTVHYTTQLSDLLTSSQLQQQLSQTFASSQSEETELSLISGSLTRIGVTNDAVSTAQPMYDRQQERRTYFGMPAEADQLELDEAGDRLGVLEGRSGIASRYTDDVLTLSRANTRVTTPRTGSPRSSFSEP